MYKYDSTKVTRERIEAELDFKIPDRTPPRKEPVSEAPRRDMNKYGSTKVAIYGESLEFELKLVDAIPNLKEEFSLEKPLYNLDTFTGRFLATA